MKYTVETKKSVEQASEDLIQSVADHEFGVLHIHNLKETLNNKGVEFTNECRVFEVCNPYKAKDIMDKDINLNLVLPCRISVYKENEKTLIGMIKPKSVVLHLTDSKSLISLVEDVEETLFSIINKAI